jgi:predicted enzyme related to lactoylglutathione lyase
MLESSHIVAFAAATDLHRARAFYEQVLGRTVAEHNDIVLGWRVTDITASPFRRCGS